MSTIWMLLLRAALTIAIQAVSRIPEAQWAKLSDIIVDWLATIQDRLPAGSPVTAALQAHWARSHDNPPT